MKILDKTSNSRKYRESKSFMPLFLIHFMYRKLRSATCQLIPNFTLFIPLAKNKRKTRMSFAPLVTPQARNNHHQP